MKTINVKNTQEFLDTSNKFEENSVINLLPGEYFSLNDAMTLSIKNNITIQGQSAEPRDTIINARFLIGNHATVILKNVAIAFDNPKGNTIALYENSKLYGQNILVHRYNPHKWDTIYCKDSAISLNHCFVRSNDYDNTPGLCMENSQLYTNDTLIYFLVEHHSVAYLNGSVIDFSTNIDQNSSLFFDGIYIDSTINDGFSDFYVRGNSTIKGKDLCFSKDGLSIDIFDSTFEVTDFSTFYHANWHYDDKSNVIVDGERPFNCND